MYESLIPVFIQEKKKENKLSGKLEGAVIFIDLVGFTSTTHSLIKYGKGGEEVASEIINELFEPATQSINSRGGFISSFAGDAFTAIFPGKKAVNAIYAAEEIKRNFSDFRIETDFGEFHLKNRIGLSHGEMEWNIIESPTQDTYFFRGNPIDSSAEAEHNCPPGEITVDSKMKELIEGRTKLKKVNKEYYRIDSITEKEKKKETSFPTSDLNLIRDFVPSPVLSLEEMGEFRNCVSLFISFTDTKNLDNFIKKIIEKTYMYGGFFNKVDFGDKGGIILILFGAPTAIERPIIRSVEFISDLKESFLDEESIKIGMTYGPVYAGMIGCRDRAEYTAIGEYVNLASRFTMKSDWGEILIDKRIENEIKDKFVTENHGKYKFKGFMDKVQVYQLKKRKKESKKFFTGKMVGRRKELAKLKNIVHKIKTGGFGGIVYVDGDTGIGKSRLVAELQRKIKKEEFNWFTLLCDEILKESFNPVIYFLRNYFGYSNENTREENKRIFEERYDNLVKKTKSREIKNELKRTKSILGGLLNLRWANSLYENLDAKGRYENTLYAVKNLIKAESNSRPTIVFIEDAQWIDNDTGELLRVLVRNVDEYPFIIITACRLDLKREKFRFDLTDSIKKEDILLDRLDESSSKKLIEDKLGSKANDKVIELIWEKSEGNPFFIEQITLYLKEENIISLRDGEYTLSYKKFEIPDKLKTIIISRIDRLKKEQKEIVKVASILGRKFPKNILSSILEKEIENEIKNIETEDIWTEISDNNYIFKHTLIRDTVYEMQLKKTRKAYHEKAAITIEEIFKKEIEQHYGELAHHYERAEIESSARKYLKLAAEFAKKNYQNEDALNFYRRLLNYTEDTKEKIQIHLRMGEILKLIGRWERAESIFRKSVMLSGELSNSGLRAESELSLGDLLWSKGSYIEASSLMENARNLYEKIDDREGLARAINGLGNIFYEQGKYDLAMNQYKKHLKISEEANNDKGISTATGNIGIILSIQGKYEKALEHFQRYKEIAEKSGNKRGESISLGNMGGAFRGLGEYERAMDCYRQQLNIAEELGDKRSISISSGNMGNIYYKLGEYNRAMDCYQRYLKISEELKDKKGISHALGNVGFIYQIQGEYQKAMDFYNRQLRIAEELGDRRVISYAQGSLGDIYLKMDQYAESEKCYEKAIRIDRELDLKNLLCSHLYSSAELKYQLNRTEAALKLLSEARKTAEEVDREEIIFNCRVLENKIIALEDSQNGIEGLEELLNEHDEESYSATLNYELYKISDEEEYREKAIELLENLYKSQPRSEFKEKIEELKL